MRSATPKVGMARDIPWLRWWTTEGQDLRLDEGLLPDPEGRYSRYTNRELVRLSDSQDRRARILLAEAGMGKSYELTKEVNRLRKDGNIVADIDLGEYGDFARLSSKLREKITTWQTSKSEHVVFAFDAFDESPIFDLPEILIAEVLEQIPSERLQIVVATRSSRWSSLLNEDFERRWGSGDVARLMLAPLTRADVELAAKDVVADPAAWASALLEVEAGALAARPATLDMLLMEAESGRLPSSRAELYRRGVKTQVSEAPRSRRSTRRRDGTPGLRRVAAAQRLAASTLFTECSSIVRRDETGAPESIALESVAYPGMPESELEDVFDSALLSGSGEVRRWGHRSIEEYLAAEELSTLPFPAAKRLLTVPGRPDRLVPRLRDTAGWFAWLSTEAFDWLVDTAPSVLLGPDLRTAPTERKAAVARAVVRDLLNNVVPEPWPAYQGLAFDGLAELVAPLLGQEHPHWRRRQAIVIIALSGERGLDSQLTEIVEQSVDDGENAFPDEPPLAETAVAALTRSCDSSVLARLKKVLSDQRPPTPVRAAVFDLMWPRVIDTTELLSLISPAEFMALEQLRRRVLITFTAAVKEGTVEPRYLVEWFADADWTPASDDEDRTLFAHVIRDALVHSQPGSQTWAHGLAMAHKFLSEFDSYLFPDAEALDALGDSKRRSLAYDLVGGPTDHMTVMTLRDSGVVRESDLTWWFDRLADTLELDHEADGRATAVIESIVSDMSADDFEAIRDSVVRLRSVVREYADQLLLGLRNRREAPARPSAPTLTLRPEAGGALYELAWERLQVDGLRGTLRHLREHALDGYAFWLPDLWAALTTDQREALVQAAQAHFGGDERLGEDCGYMAIRAYEILRVHRPDAVATIPDEAWFNLLPSVLDEPLGFQALRIAISAASRHCPDVTSALVIERMSSREDDRHRILTHLGNFRHDDIGRHAVTLLTRDVGALSPQEIGDLLLVAARMGRGEHAVEFARNLTAAAKPERATEADEKTYKTAVHAAAAILATDFAPKIFSAFASVCREAPDFYRQVMHLRREFPDSLMENLTSAQLAELYIWARPVHPTRKYQPGVIVEDDFAERSVDSIRFTLRQRHNIDAADALQEIGRALSDIWFFAEADRIRDVSLAMPIALDDLHKLFVDPKRRLVRSPDELATLIVDTLDEISEDLRTHPNLLWDAERTTQLKKPPTHEVPDVWRPTSEGTISTYLHNQLSLRLRGLVINREVVVHPTDRHGAGDRPDLLVQTTPTGTAGGAGSDDSAAPDVIAVPIEVKGCWNEDVSTAQRDQLTRKYLKDPADTNGIYVVAWFPIRDWTANDVARKRSARKLGVLDDLRESLLKQSIEIAESTGKRTHPFVLLVPRATHDS